MARIRRANTLPELRVRRLLHKLGYRFRLQWKGVPGRPDVAFPRRHKALFVHGCFWHAHEGCPVHRIPKSRPEFWKAKFARNRERDERLLKAAKQLGWDCLVIWECETKDSHKLSRRLVAFLGPPLLIPTAMADRSTSSSGGPSFPLEAA
jgi:DNA mismatch endonuclease (patch repair protein)